MSSRSVELAADSFLAASGSSLYLLSQQPSPAGYAAAASAADPPPTPQFRELLVAHGAPITTACWNRNNKVVASGVHDSTYDGGLVGYQVNRWQTAQFMNFEVLPAGETASGK